MASSVSADNDSLESYVKSLGFDVYRGSELNVLERYHQAATKHKADIVLRITGDCPLVDSELVDDLLEKFLESGVDYASNREPPTFPDGLDSEVADSIAAVEKIMKAKFGDRYKILAGVDTLALESLMMGADGWVAGLVCAFPKETVAIYELYKAGRTKEAIEIYRWFLPLLELDTTSKLVQNIKLAEVATGIGTEKVREPRLPLIGAERKNVLEIIEKSLKTRPKLPNY